MFPITLGFTIIWHGFVALVPRTIAFGLLGLLSIGLSATVQAASSVSLSWNPSPGPAIAGYRLYYGTSSGSYPGVIDVGNTTLATVPNLAPGQTYYFVVTAYNTAGRQSPPSNQVAVTIALNSLLVQRTPSNPALVTVPNPPDFDGDGQQDFLWRNTSTGQVGIWLMNGTGPKEAANIGSPPLSWVIINTGDFDGDGKSDILWQLAKTSQYGVWFMNGTQIAGVQNFTLPPYAGQICCVADFDGDGLADVVTFNRSAGAIYFWKNTGSLQFVLQSSYGVSSASGWLPLGAALLNGPSGSPSVIWRNAFTGQIAAWLMRGFTWTSVTSFGNPGTDVVLCGFGSLSGDGRASLLLFDTSNHAVGYCQTNGAQTPNSVFLAYVSGTWVPVGVENLDGTGNAEIIWRETSTGTVGAWQVSGSRYSIYIGSIPASPTWQLQPVGLTP